MTQCQIEDFIDGYIEAMLWAGLDWGPVEAGEDNPIPLDENYGPDDLTVEATIAIRAKCRDFCESHRADLDLYGESRTFGEAGHDFYLTRNGHGVGFWDRGLGELGERLTQASQSYRETAEFILDGKVNLDQS